MQTFVPYPQTTASAMCLDKQRLNKQITECYQLLNAIKGTGGWGNHPAARMWAGYETALYFYAKTMFREFVVNRGGADTHKSWWKIYNEHHPGCGDRCVFPPWWGDEAIHSSHRGRLLHKGNIDVLRKRMRDIGIKKPDLYCQFHFNQKRLYLRDLTVEQVRHLSNVFDTAGSPCYTNWYEQFGWSEQPANDYIWPVEVKHERIT